MSFYKDIFMNQFISALKEFQSIEKRDAEILLEDFLAEDIKEEIKIRNYEAFEETCKKLCNVGCYSSVISFMYGVFLCGKAYDLAKLKNILDKIEIRDDIKLSELCADFFLYSQKTSVFYHHGAYNYDFDSIDPYKGDAGKYFTLSGYSFGKIAKSIPEYIFKRLFNMDVRIDDISRQDIDNIVAESVRIKTLKIEKENECINRQNTIQEEHEKQGNIKLPRLVPEKATEFKKNLEAVGLLLDIFKAAVSKENEDIIYYIQAEYLWPIMETVPWKQQDILEVQLMGIMLESYLSCIYDFEVSKNHDIYARIGTDRNYNETDFLDEMVNNKPGLLSRPAIEFGNKNRQLGRTMSEVIYQARNVLKKLLPNYLYSFMMAMVPYLLFFSGYCDEASEFLIKNYNQINSEDRQRFFLQMTIVKCILSGKNLQRINILYGFFVSELNRRDMVKNEILSALDEIIRYIKDVKEYLYLSNDYTIKTRRAWHDIVFGDGSIMKNIELAEKHLALGKILPDSLFDKLLLYVESFCNRSGILLELLGLPREDNYDKLPGALSDELISRGQSIISNINEYIAFYKSLNQLKLRQSMDIFLQRHISKLMDEALEDTLEKLKAMRAEISNRKPDLNKADLNIENILKKFDEVVSELGSKLENQYIGREDVELYIDRLQMYFIETYNLDVPGNNLINKLPYEERKNCNNFLVTSEIVYKMLSRRADRNKLDFSPALIPLTKALELVLNMVFQKIPFTESSIDEKSREHYFYNGDKKASIELGPCINLLKDSKKIFVKKNKYGNYVLSWRTGFLEGRSRFAAIHGEQAINFDRLSKFKGLKLMIEQASKHIITIAFNEDTEFNRMLLIKGLEYVKDNYRNIVAHKDGVSPDEVETCRRILIQSENLLWILLYIINC